MSGESASASHEPVRLSDVARRAGVSTGTVSNTINHPERVHPRTRTAVEAAIQDLGFVPNQQARVLSGLRSNVIGLVVLDVESPFYTETAHAIERAVRESDHVVMLCNSEGEHERESDLLRMLAAQSVRGVLLAPAGSGTPPPLTDAPPNLPVVLLDFPGDDSQCSVSVDNIAGGHLAASHLLALGHKKIAFIGGMPALRQFTERAQGARNAIIAAGLDPDEALLEVSASGLGIRDGQRAVELLLESGKLPDAIFCGNDMLAFGAYRGLAAAGVRAPEDVALVGYDDIDFARDWIVPLTSIRQPIDDLGRIAAQLLIEHSAGGEDHVHRRVVLQPELVIRRSSDHRASP